MKRSQSRSDADNGRVAANGVSRRELIAAGGAMAAAATSSSLIANTASAQGSAGADATLDRLRRAAGDSSRRILIRGGTIISMDTGVGNFAAGTS
jgi:5-methylthioadenosine/S-adenosylhomocysteine deaminase